MIDLYDHQKLAANQLKTGSILCGGVGSGKTKTAVYYYYKNERPKDLYIITTALKRDTLDWERECSSFLITNKRELSIDGVLLTVDSWNRIKQYKKIKNAFFIFDEQKLVGSGSWVRSFLKIAEKNNWILLSATPADTWMDYVPVFVANGFYKNRTEFIRRHVVYNSFTKYPKIDRYVEINRLKILEKKITVVMDYVKPTTSIYKDVSVDFNKDLFDRVAKDRWNPFENKPIKEVSGYFQLMRKVVNSDPSRITAVKDLLTKHHKIILFYNFNYELDLLRKAFKNSKSFRVAEYNGHKHEQIPDALSWLYLVQYTSGSEGWNCIETDTIIFYSLNYSFRVMTQSAGRIDRLNTPFKELYYYTLKSKSAIDLAISRSIKDKKTFNENKFLRASKTYGIVER